MIGADDLNQIKKQTANVYIDPASIKIQEPVIDDDDEDDDDDIEDEDGDINPKMEKAITIMGIAKRCSDHYHHYLPVHHVSRGYEV